MTKYMIKKMRSRIDKFEKLQDRRGIVRVKVRAIYMDLDAAWSDEQLRWIKTHNNKVVEGRMVTVKGEGRKLFQPNQSPLVLRDEEFDLV